MFKMEDFDTKELKIPKGGNQNPQIEGQTTEEKGQKKKQITIYKYTHKTKTQITQLLFILTTINSKGTGAING